MLDTGTSTDQETAERLRTILGVGADFDYEIVSKEDWYGRRLIARGRPTSEETAIAAPAPSPRHGSSV